jgi:hypothetical protein
MRPLFLLVALLLLPACKRTCSDPTEDFVNQHAARPPAAASTSGAVLIVAYPLDAQVRLGMTALGSSPVRVPLAVDDRAQITVSREGYVEQSFLVEGRRNRVDVELVPNVAPPPQLPGAAERPPVPVPCTPCNKAPTAPNNGKCPPGEILLYGKCDRL